MKDQSRQNVQDKSEKDNEFIAPRNKPTRHRLTDLRNGDFLQREKQHESQVETSKTEDTFTHDFEEQKEEHRKMETVYIDNIMPEIQHPHADGERDGGMLKEGELLVDDSRLMKDTDIELKYDSEPVWKEIDDSLSMISSLTDELQASKDYFLPFDLKGLLSFDLAIQSKILEAIENFKRNLNDGLDSLARNCEEAINEHLVQSKSNTDSRARISELTEIVESLKCRPSLGNLRN